MPDTWEIKMASKLLNSTCSSCRQDKYQAKKLYYRTVLRGRGYPESIEKERVSRVSRVLRVSRDEMEGWGRIQLY